MILPQFRCYKEPALRRYLLARARHPRFPKHAGGKCTADGSDRDYPPFFSVQLLRIKTSNVLDYQRARRIFQENLGLPKQLEKISPFRLASLRISPVFRHGAANALNSSGSPRSSAQSAMKPTAPILHRGTLAFSHTPSLGATTSSLGEVAGRVPVLQPATPLFIGSYFAFHC